MIKDKIKIGTFEYVDFFPDSPRAVKAVPNSFGALADEWLSSKGALTPATLRQYSNAVGVWKRLLGVNISMDALTYRLLVSKIGGYRWTSPDVCNNYLTPLRGIFGLEYFGRRAIENPMLAIKNL